MPLHREDALQASGGAAGADCGDLVPGSRARPALRHQPGKGTLRARPEGLPGAAGESLPSPAKGGSPQIGAQGPTQRRQRRGG